jgi:hypothetical protein
VSHRAETYPRSSSYHESGRVECRHDGMAPGRMARRIGEREGQNGKQRGLAFVALAAILLDDLHPRHRLRHRAVRLNGHLA